MFNFLHLIRILNSILSVPVFFYSVYVRLCRQCNYYQDYRTSLENARNVVSNLLDEHNRLLDELSSCQESLLRSGNHIGSLPLFNPSIIHSFICSTLLHLENIEEEDRSRGTISRFLRSGSIACQCHELQDLANRLMYRLRQMRDYFPLITYNAHDTRTAQNFMDNLRVIRDSCEDMIQTYQGSTEALSPNAIDPPTIIQFKSQVYAAKIPSYIFLDFNADTPEGRLKNCILGREDEIHDVFTSRKVVLEGQKGSGRTCIMRALPTCQDIQRKFVGPGKGGIYSISVGQNPDSSDVKNQMSEIVNMSGGWHLRERILQENLSAGVFIMAKWFVHKDTLFLVDGKDSSPFAKVIEDQLETLSKISSSSVVVFSRRIASRRVAGENNDNVVHVPSGIDFGAEEWLFRSLEIDPRRQMEENTKAALNEIIALCNREKRLLGQVGVCYKLVCRNCINNESGWESLARQLSVVMMHKRDAEVALTALFLDLMKPQISSAFPGSQSI